MFSQMLIKWAIIFRVDMYGGILDPNHVIFQESERVVSKKEGIDFAREYGCLYTECSAKTRVNVEQCFEELVMKVHWLTCIARYTFCHFIYKKNVWFPPTLVPICFYLFALSTIQHLRKMEEMIKFWIPFSIYRFWTHQASWLRGHLVWKGTSSSRIHHSLMHWVVAVAHGDYNVF